MPIRFRLLQFLSDIPIYYLPTSTTLPHFRTDSSDDSKRSLNRLTSTIRSQLPSPSLPSIKLSPEKLGLPPHFLDWIDKIRAEVSFAPGSVADEIWKESQDPKLNPEIEKDAHVWLGNDFSQEEMEFSRKRSGFTKLGLARYLGLKEEEVDERDVPVIAVAGSGGGYRAMLGTTGYFKAMKSSGLFDCVTYMAGIYPSYRRWIRQVR